MMVTVVLTGGTGIRPGFKLTFHKPYFLYADCFQASSDADFWTFRLVTITLSISQVLIAFIYIFLVVMKRKPIAIL